MARTRATAVSALVLAVGLTGAAVYPFVAAAASAGSAITKLDPNVDPCDADQVCDTPEVTVTVTTTLGTPTPDEPETTITKTIKQKAKKTPTKTPTPTPSKTTSSPALQPLPSQNTLPPVTSGPPPTPEQSVQLPTVAPTETLPSSTPPPSPEETPTESVQLEVHNAAPEFDQQGLTRTLALPALVLVLVVLFAVLILEGRLRRMAHAAAIRKAGPPLPLAGADPHGYPAGPGYTTAGFPAPGYPGGTAYAPIISFVPVQTYPTVQPPAYPEPAPYPQAPSPEPVVLHPDEFDSYSHEPTAEYRAPFEPLIPADQAPPDDAPTESGRLFGPASAAEAGDSEPWQGSSGDDDEVDDAATLIAPIPLREDDGRR